MIEILLERTLASRGQAVFRLRPAILERLGARDVTCLFELASMHAQVAIRCIEQLLEITELHAIVHSERADDGQARTLVNDVVEIRRAGWSFTHGRRFFFSCRVALSHRTSRR